MRQMRKDQVPVLRPGKREDLRGVPGEGEEPMRKPSKKTLHNKLDRITSLIIRSRGVCAKCRTEDYSRLQTAHIFHRRHFSVRWDFDNLLCLCSGCHLYWAHLEPIEFTEFVREYLGEEKYAALKIKAHQIKQWSIEEMQNLLAEYQTLNKI
jgi:hypothetical protein